MSVHHQNGCLGGVLKEGDSYTAKIEQVTCVVCKEEYRAKNPYNRLPSVGQKHDDGKERWDLVQPLWLTEYVKVLTFGAQKYAPDNWRKVEDQRRRYFAATLRHLFAWWRGERNDPETGLHHLGHAACCIAFLAEVELE